MRQERQTKRESHCDRPNEKQTHRPEEEKKEKRDREKESERQGKSHRALNNHRP